MNIDNIFATSLKIENTCFQIYFKPETQEDFLFTVFDIFHLLVDIHPVLVKLKLLIFSIL